MSSAEPSAPGISPDGTQRPDLPASLQLLGPHRIAQGGDTEISLFKARTKVDLVSWGAWASIRTLKRGPAPGPALRACGQWSVSLVASSRTQGQTPVGWGAGRETEAPGRTWDQSSPWGEALISRATRESRRVAEDRDRPSSPHSCYLKAISAPSPQ